MTYNVDFDIAPSEQIEAALSRQIQRIRLARNVTQAALAAEAGVSLRTIRRLEKGEGVSLDTFIRVLTALGLQRSLEVLLPDPDVRPIERTHSRKHERKRARPAPPRTQPSSWTWGDTKEDDE